MNALVFKQVGTVRLSHALLFLHADNFYHVVIKRFRFTNQNTVVLHGISYRTVFPQQILTEPTVMT